MRSPGRFDPHSGVHPERNECIVELRALSRRCDARGIIDRIRDTLTSHACLHTDTSHDCTGLVNALAAIGTHAASKAMAAFLLQLRGARLPHALTMAVVSLEWPTVELLEALCALLEPVTEESESHEDVEDEDETWEPAGPTLREFQYPTLLAAVHVAAEIVRFRLPGLRAERAVASVTSVLRSNLEFAATARDQFAAMRSEAAVDELATWEATADEHREDIVARHHHLRPAGLRWAVENGQYPRLEREARVQHRYAHTMRHPFYSPVADSAHERHAGTLLRALNNAEGRLGSHTPLVSPWLRHHKESLSTAAVDALRPHEGHEAEALLLGTLERHVHPDGLHASPQLVGRILEVLGGWKTVGSASFSEALRHLLRLPLHGPDPSDADATHARCTRACASRCNRVQHLQQCSADCSVRCRREQETHEALRQLVLRGMGPDAHGVEKVALLLNVHAPGADPSVRSVLRTYYGVHVPSFGREAVDVEGAEPPITSFSPVAPIAARRLQSSSAYDADTEPEPRADCSASLSADERRRCQLIASAAVSGSKSPFDFAGNVSFNDWSLTFIDVVLSHQPFLWKKFYGKRDLFGDFGGAGVGMELRVRNSVWVRLGLFGGGFGVDFDNFAWIGAEVLGIRLSLFKAQFRLKWDLTYIIPLPVDQLGIALDSSSRVGDRIAPHVTLASENARAILERICAVQSNASHFDARLTPMMIASSNEGAYRFYVAAESFLAQAVALVDAGALFGSATRSCVASDPASPSVFSAVAQMRTGLSHFTAAIGGLAVSPDTLTFLASTSLLDGLGEASRLLLSVLSRPAIERLAAEASNATTTTSASAGLWAMPQRRIAFDGAATLVHAAVEEASWSAGNLIQVGVEASGSSFSVLAAGQSRLAAGVCPADSLSCTPLQSSTRMQTALRGSSVPAALDALISGLDQSVATPWARGILSTLHTPSSARELLVRSLCHPHPEAPANDTGCSPNATSALIALDAADRLACLEALTIGLDPSSRAAFALLLGGRVLLPAPSSTLAVGSVLDGAALVAESLARLQPLLLEAQTQSIGLRRTATSLVNVAAMVASAGQPPALGDPTEELRLVRRSDGAVLEPPAGASRLSPASLPSPTTGAVEMAVPSHFACHNLSRALGLMASELGPGFYAFEEFFAAVKQGQWGPAAASLQLSSWCISSPMLCTEVAGAVRAGCGAGGPRWVSKPAWKRDAGGAVASAVSNASFLGSPETLVVRGQAWTVLTLLVDLHVESEARVECEPPGRPARSLCG